MSSIFSLCIFINGFAVILVGVGMHVWVHGERIGRVGKRFEGESWFPVADNLAWSINPLVQIKVYVEFKNKISSDFLCNKRTWWQHVYPQC
jgi:uncharacterized protein (DUF488 family)